MSTRIYVASSWRNVYQPAVVDALRALPGCEVYDFRNPAPGDSGFAWSDIDVYPAGTVFVHEDLDLRGTAGQKRFAYRAVHHAMAAKCPQEAQNPAYTSQCCPSCEYVSRRNRAGTKFICRSCGRKSHADAVGGINLLGRSEAKQVSVDDDRFRVRNLLRARYWARRNGCDLALDSASVRSHSEALVPSSPSLTTEGPASASAQAQNFGRRARIAFGSEK